ncbi:lytic transglycosylase [Psychroserpens luteolus]|uniref:lytic transglycosylase n=1 Tax=Psychroserpens luteolus TaxID=2855840 RepID=UPI001E2ECBD6|nr:LysM peptidoglycan-binding domain-containing protein [Psychroserpens luteolus]MCD2259337.1 LysM peptidoglycan-binding domain-containing protein [Psychroserpens luteolus]
MLKSFKLIVLVLVLTASSFGAVAQTNTYKDVLLNGKPAKLNIKTGEIILVEASSIKAKDSIVGKTEIQANLITNTPNTNKNDSTLVIVTNRPDTLTNYFKKKNTLATTTTDSLQTKSIPEQLEPKLSEKAKKATTLVYDISQPVTTETNDSNYHTVKKGETLYALSKRYNTSLDELKRANNLDTTLIKIGQELRVRNFEDLYNSDVWIVVKGDTLYSIAKKTNTTVAGIKALNGLTSNLIKIGQKLQLK